MYKIIIPLLLFSTWTSADSNSTSQMENINAIINYMNSSNLITDDPHCENCKTPEDFYNSCYRSICGLSPIPITADRYKDYLLTTVPEPEILKSETDFINAISPFINIRLETEINDLNQIITQLETGEIPIISDEIKNTVPFFIFAKKNRDVSIIPEDLIKHSNEVLKMIRSFTSKSSEFNMRNVDGLAYLKKTYKGQPMASILKIESSLLRAQVESIKKILNSKSQYINSMFEERIDPKTMSKIDNNLELSTEEVSSLVREVGKFQLLSNLFANDAYKKQVSKFPFSSLIKMLKSPEFLVKSKRLRDKLVNLKNPERLKNTLELCTNSFSSNYFGLPTINENENFDKVTLSAKNDILTKILPKLSRHSQGIMNTAVKNISFELPPTASEVIARLNEKSKLRYDAENRAVRHAQVYKDENLQGNLIGDAFEIAQYDDSISDYYIVEEVLNLGCDEYASPHLRDAAYSSIGRIQVGWAGVKNSEAGKSVLYHEIGHVMSAAFKGKDMSKETRRTYQAIKSCISNMNPNPHDDVTDIYADRDTGVETSIPISAYAEEDFADLISGITGKSSDLATNLNTGCFNLMNFDESQQSLLTDRDKSSDTHSPEFYRLLHIQYLQNGKLPVSCEKYMNKVGDIKTFNNCWDQATAK